MSDQPIATRNELARFNKRAAFKTFMSDPTQRATDPDGAVIVLLAIVVVVCLVAFWIAKRW